MLHYCKPNLAVTSNPRQTLECRNFDYHELDDQVAVKVGKMIRLKKSTNLQRVDEQKKVGFTLTFIFIDTNNNYTFSSSNPDEFIYRSNTSS